MVFSYYLICKWDFDAPLQQLLLILCGLLIAYGTYLFFDSLEASTDSLAQYSQLSQNSIGNQSEVMISVHEAAIIPKASREGWLKVVGV
jgi:hypothetical protein